MTALSPIVLAWLNTSCPAVPRRRAPSTTGAAGSLASLATLVTVIAPSRTQTTSVNVPPTSTPQHQLRWLRRDLDAQRRVGAERRRLLAADRLQAALALADVEPAALGEDPVLGEQAVGPAARACSRHRAALRLEVALRGPLEGVGHRRGRAQAALGGSSASSAGAPSANAFAPIPLASSKTSMISAARRAVREGVADVHAQARLEHVRRRAVKRRVHQLLDLRLEHAVLPRVRREDGVGGEELGVQAQDAVPEVVPVPALLA